MRKVVMIQPKGGVYSKVLKPWVPLSVLSASVKLALEGYDIEIIDQRVNPKWEDDLIRSLEDDPICVGVTSMSGSQILSALEASRVVKGHSKIPVVWGGVHATLFPQQTVENDQVDIVVKGEGEETFYELVKRLEDNSSLDGLLGVLFKRNGGIIENPERPFIDLDDFPLTPYHLVDLRNYMHRFFSENDVIEIESSRGCPFSCTFCYNTLYSKRKWRALSAEKVVGRIRSLVNDFSVRTVFFSDDGFFIDKQRVRDIMTRIIDEKLDVKMGFQGVRIDTFDHLSDDDIELVNRAGGRFLQFGVESGSDTILKLINKKISVERVIALNRRLNNYPQLIPLYNFICGFPTETREDLFKSTTLAWTLLKDNKKAMISPFHHYKPYPGTKLFEMVSSQDYPTPGSLDEWGDFDWTDLQQNGQDRKSWRFLKNVEMTSILVDKKMENQSDSVCWTFLAKLYRPIARFRLRNNFYSYMPEGRFMK